MVQISPAPVSRARIETMSAISSSSSTTSRTAANNSNDDPDPLDEKRHGSTAQMSTFKTPASSSSSGRSNRTPKAVKQSAPAPMPISRLIWDGGTLWKIPFHTMGKTPKRRYLRLKRIEEDDGDSDNDGSDDEDSDAFQTPPPLSSSKKRRLQNTPNRPNSIGRINANKYNSVEVEVTLTAGGFSFSNNSSSSSSKKRPRLATNPLCLEWFDPDVATTSTSTSNANMGKEMYLQDVIEIKSGHATQAFMAFKAKNGIRSLPDASLCFSIVGRNRTLDFAAESVHEATNWKNALISLLEQYQQSNGGTKMQQQQQQCASPISRLTSPDFNDSFSSVGSGSGTWKPEKNDKVFAAAKSGNIKSLTKYIDRDGCPVDIMEEPSGDTPLIAACRLGLTNIVDLTLKRGARNDPHPTFGQTALQAAVSAGHAECVRLLLETAAPSGADVIIVNHEEYSSDNTRREAPLHVASRCGSVSIVELLVLHGANLGLVDSNGRTCLHCTAQAGHVTCLKFLLDAGGDVFVEKRDDQGHTCLHLAIRANRLECVKALVEIAVDVNAIAHDGASALEMATSRKLGKIAQLLKDYGAHDDDEPDLYEERSDQMSISSYNEQYRTPAARMLPRPHGDKELTVGRVERRASTGMAPQTQRNIFEGLQVHHATPANRRSTIPGSANHGGAQNTPVVYGTAQQSPSLDPLYTMQHTPCGPPHYTQGGPSYTGMPSPYVSGHVAQVQWNGGWSPAPPAAAFGPQHYSYAMQQPHPPMLSPIIVEEFIVDSDAWRTYQNPLTGIVFYQRLIDNHSQWTDPRVGDASNNTTAGVVSTPQRSPKVVAFAGEDAPVANAASAPENDTASANISTPSRPQQPADSGEAAGADADDLKTYRLMIKRRVPAAAVRHKMTMEGIDSKRIEAFFASGSVEQDDTKVHSTNRPNAEEVEDNATSQDTGGDARSAMLAMIRAKAGKTTAQKEMAQSSSSRLSEEVKNNAAAMDTDDDPRSAMLAMIRARAGKAVAPKETTFTSEANPQPSETSNDGTSQDCSNSSSADTPSTNESEDGEVHKAISKYKKMLAMRIPREAVKHAMKRDGNDDPRISASVFGSGSNESKHPEPNEADIISNNDSEPVTRSRSSDGPTIADVAKDAVLAKYATMCRVGVPALSAIHKMVQENVAQEKIDLFKQAYKIKVEECAPKKKRKAKEPPSTSPSNPAPPRSTRRSRSNVEMQKIHWTAVTEEDKLQDSVWLSGDTINDNVDDSELRELEGIFSAKPPATKVVREPQSGPSKRAKKHGANLIEFKRANNVAISLAQFRAFANYDDLCLAVVSQDISKLNAEKLQNMIKILPTADEIAVVKNHESGTDDLGQAELFFLAVSKVPRFSAKLNAFLFSLQFNSQITELRQSIDLLENACTQVVSSNQLSCMLRRLLAVGNIINESSGRPKAAGITLDSLIKTAKKKGSDNKTSVVDHVVATVMKADDPDKIAEFASSIPAARAAKRIDVKDVRSTVRRLEGQLKQIANVLSVEENSDVASDEGTAAFIEKSTQFANEAEDKIKDVAAKLSDAEEKVSRLCKFFAEDPTTCQVSTIFSILVEFASLVDKSKESWLRKDRAAKRRTQRKTERSSVNTPARPKTAPDGASRSTPGPNRPMTARPDVNALLSAIKSNRKAAASACSSASKSSGATAGSRSRPQPDRSALLSAIKSRR